MHNNGCGCANVNTYIIHSCDYICTYLYIVHIENVSGRTQEVGWERATFYFTTFCNL